MNCPKLSRGDQSRWRYENRIEKVVTGRELQIHSRNQKWVTPRLSSSGVKAKIFKNQNFNYKSTNRRVPEFPAARTDCYAIYPTSSVSVT